MKTQTVMAVARKDWVEVRQNPSAWAPMLVVPLIFIVLLPLAFFLIPPAAGIQASSLGSDADLRLFLEHMPPSVADSLQGLDDFQKILVLMLGYFFAPMFLILPLMFSSVIGSESFAGEKERKTLEALLYTSATDFELFLGKVLAAFIPAVGISWLSFGVYTLVVNLAGLAVFPQAWFPLPGWWPLIFWVTPAVALLSISATVLISARARTFMGAYQSSASLVLLVLALVAGQAAGVLYLTVGMGLLVGLLFWVVAVALTLLAVKGFNRTALLVNK